MLWSISVFVFKCVLSLSEDSWVINEKNFKLNYFVRALVHSMRETSLILSFSYIPNNKQNAQKVAENSNFLSMQRAILCR